MCPENMVSKLLDENTANIEKAESLTAVLSTAQMSWRPQLGKWSIAQNLAHLSADYTEHLDTIAGSIAAARAKGGGISLWPFFRAKLGGNCTWYYKLIV
jgi:DinB superfamily